MRHYPVYVDDMSPVLHTSEVIGLCMDGNNHMCKRFVFQAEQKAMAREKTLAWTVE